MILSAYHGHIFSYQLRPQAKEVDFECLNVKTERKDARTAPLTILSPSLAWLPS